MSRKRLALILPAIALIFSMLACNLPGQAAGVGGASGEARAEVERRVNEALAATDQAAPDIPIVEDEGQQEAAQTPTSEPTAAPEPTLVPTATPIPLETGCSDRIDFVADITVEDGTDFEPGEHFTKTWRLRNAGSCTWSSSYDLVFSHGDAMSGPAAMGLPGVVSPGQTVDLSVDLVAPDTEGGYQGYWLLRNGDGALFGLGASADVAFWVEIEVIDTDSGMLLMVPIITLQPILLFTSSGTGQNLADGWCFDLDAGSTSSCGNPEADFQYDASITMEGFPPHMVVHTIVDPGHDALFGGKRAEVPTGVDCQSSVLTAADRNIENGIYCYRTSGGKYGYLRVTHVNTSAMTFDWGTYNSP
jgi:hypothetical protein